MLYHTRSGGVRIECLDPLSGLLRLHNSGGTPVDVWAWQLCWGPGLDVACVSVSSATLLSGYVSPLRAYASTELLLELPAWAGELALYRPGPVGFAGTMEHYVRWDDRGVHGAAALRKGVWIEGDLVGDPPQGQPDLPRLMTPEDMASSSRDGVTDLSRLFYTGLQPLSGGSANWQLPIRIKQITVHSDLVVLANVGCFTVNAAGLVLSYGGVETRVGQNALKEGSTSLEPGATLVVQVPRWRNMTEAALWVPGATTTDREWWGSILHYVQWGRAGGEYETVAVAANMWEAGKFVQGKDFLSYAGRLVGLPNWARLGVDAVRLSFIDPVSQTVEIVNTGPSHTHAGTMCLCVVSSCMPLGDLHGSANRLEVLRRERHLSSSRHRALQQQEPHQDQDPGGGGEEGDFDLWSLHPRGTAVLSLPSPAAIGGCGETALYRSNAGCQPASGPLGAAGMVHYVKWGSQADCGGSAETQLESAAIAAGLWGEVIIISHTLLLFLLLCCCYYIICRGNLCSRHLC